MARSDHPSRSPPTPPSLILASRSPRRRDLLSRGGFTHTAVSPPVDDSDLVRPAGVPPHHWVAALAYFKAAAVAPGVACSPDAPTFILGADTVCVVENDVLGQPRDADHARAMIRRMENTSHEVLTGVALLQSLTKTRLIFAQRAVVRVGHIGDERIDHYLLSNDWQGKAGAYNLEERIEAGWPIEYTGDPTTVMGLPMDALAPILVRALGLPSSTTEEVSR